MMEHSVIMNIFGNVGGGRLRFSVYSCGLKRELGMLIASKTLAHLERFCVTQITGQRNPAAYFLEKSVNMKLFLVLIILLFEVPTGNLSKCTMNS